MSTNPSNLGVVYWYENDGLASRISATASSLGWEVKPFFSTAEIPDGVDAVLAYGPFGSLVPLATQIQSRPPGRRPPFALWLTEQLSNPRLPECLHHPLSCVRSYMERLVVRVDKSGEWRYDARSRWLFSSGKRLRYYGDLVWLRRERILSVLAVGSRWIAEFLRARGFDPLVAYLGTHPDWWAALDLERDIDVLWLGAPATKRRRRILRQIGGELRTRGVRLLSVDGVEHPPVFDEQRTVLLNRTKVVLNILRTRWDNHSLRFFLAAPNRALVVTEPTLDHVPFIPGIHCVEAPIPELADAICRYVTDERIRTPIVDEAYLMATQELTMARAVDQILARLSEGRR